jgi:transposase
MNSERASTRFSESGATNLLALNFPGPIQARGILTKLHVAIWTGVYHSAGVIQRRKEAGGHAKAQRRNQGWLTIRHSACFCCARKAKLVRRARSASTQFHC